MSLPADRRIERHSHTPPVGLTLDATLTRLLLLDPGKHAALKIIAEEALRCAWPGAPKRRKNDT